MTAATTTLAGYLAAVATPLPVRSHGASGYRACELCSHHAHVPQARPALHCGHPVVTGPLRLLPVALARARHGGCGPDAVHMLAPGLTS